MWTMLDSIYVSTGVRVQRHARHSIQENGQCRPRGMGSVAVHAARSVRLHLFICWLTAWVRHQDECMTMYILDPSVSVDAFPVRRIDHPNQRVCLLEIVLPVCSQGFLAADIPCKRVLSDLSNQAQRDVVHMFSLYLACMSAHERTKVTRQVVTLHSRLS